MANQTDLTIERGDTVTVYQPWPTAAIDASDVWRFQISRSPSWVGRHATDLLVDVAPTVTATGDGVDVTITLSSAQTESLPNRCHYGFRVTNDNGSDTITTGRITFTTSPVAPGAAA